MSGEMETKGSTSWLTGAATINKIGWKSNSRSDLGIQHLKPWRQFWPMTSDRAKKVELKQLKFPIGMRVDVREAWLGIDMHSTKP